MRTLVSNIYYYQDELGSTSHVADASGALLEYYLYDLYGKPQFFSSTSQQLNSSTYGLKDLGNGGSRWMPELGLYDDRNRFMSPDLGRFLQPDPIGFKGDASNLYRYCGNDWANRTDPTGTADERSDERKAENTNTTNDNGMTDFQQQQLQYLSRASSTFNTVSWTTTVWFRSNPFAQVAQSIQAPQASLTLRAEIRAPDAQAGVKMNQTVTVDQLGKASQSVYVGNEEVKGVRLQGVGYFYAKRKPSPGQGRGIQCDDGRIWICCSCARGFIRQSSDSLCFSWNYKFCNATGLAIRLA